jgi:hypothetical protein
MSTHTTDRPAPAATRPARYDIYAGIHRALRLFMTDTLGRLGWLDCGDPIETTGALNQLDSLLAFCRRHLDHENTFLHPAIEARHPGRTQRLAGDHGQHLEEIAALRAESAALRATPGAPQALRLYRHLALFIAENFQHMQVEETAMNEALWEAYSDAEIMAIHDRLVATLDPAEQALVLRWMTPALPPAERTAMFSGMREQMPPQAFAMVMDAARAALNDTAWAKLARSLGLPPVPGLVEV